MMWRIGAAGAIAFLSVGEASAAPTPACMANLTCRCAVQAGARRDEFRKKWIIDEMQQTSWENCISRGLQASPTQAKPSRKPKPP
jgi:hypothetical protein